MKLWRLSVSDYAKRLDGGYGLLHDGRWNVRGQPVTYCSTHPSLCILEKLAHIEDPSLMPNNLVMVEIEIPDDILIHDVTITSLMDGWQHNEAFTQFVGTLWFTQGNTPLLRVPSVIAAYENATDRNIVINHAHPEAASAQIVALHSFTFDPRL